MAKRKQQVSLADQVRAEIHSQGLSCYRIAQETGASESTIGRFVNAGSGLNMETLDKVLKVLGLELVRTADLVELRKRKG